MSYQTVIEGFVIGTALFAAVRVTINAHRQLKRVERGVRLVNYIVDRANEREAMEGLGIRQDRRSRSRSV